MPAPNEKLTDLYRRGREMMAPDEPPQPDITAWAAGAFGASPELTAAWLAVMEAGIKSGEMPPKPPKWTYLEPQIVPYSSRVGSSIIVRESGPEGSVLCQLAILNVSVEDGQVHREQSEAVAALVADALRSYLTSPSDPKQDRSRADDTGGAA